MTNEERLVKIAKRFDPEAFAEEDYSNEKLINDAVSFGLGIFLIFPKADEIKSLTNDKENLYMVRYNPFIVMLAKAAVAANCGIAEYGDEDKITIIYVDNSFRKLDPEVQKAVIAHEVGHTMSGHTAEHNARRLNKENQADSYAASIIGVDNMIAALSKLHGCDFIARLELKRRIKMLKKQAQ